MDRVPMKSNLELAKFIPREHLAGLFIAERGWKRTRKIWRARTIPQESQLILSDGDFAESKHFTLQKLRRPPAPVFSDNPEKVQWLPSPPRCRRSVIVTMLYSDRASFSASVNFSQCHFFKGFWCRVSFTKDVRWYTTLLYNEKLKFHLRFWYLFQLLQSSSKFHYKIIES